MQAPIAIKSLSQSEAEQLKIIFEGQGATVVLTPADDGTITLVATYGVKDQPTGVGAGGPADVDGQQNTPGVTFRGVPAATSGFRATIVSCAIAEWLFFGSQEYDINGHLSAQGHQESQEGYYQRVGEYWLVGTGLHGVDGRITGMPWSAAFISWLMVTSGAGVRFRTSRMHSVYIDQAIRDRLSGRPEAGYWGWRLNEMKPSVGDLVCWGREPGVDYDHQKQGTYNGHSDLVVAVEQDKVWIIGGNVGNSVTKRPLRLDDDGFLAPAVVNGENLFAVMHCRIGESAVQPLLNAEPSPAVPADDNSLQIAWGKLLGPAFKKKVIDVAQSLRCDPNHLTAAIAFETGETFSPSEKNRLSGATGLIQFMPSTAKSLGTSTEELATMSAVKQMDFVARYLSPYAGRLNGLSDVYMAILWPAAVGFPDSRPLFARGTVQYAQNQGLDVNSDGIVTKGEAASKVQGKLDKGLGSSLIG